MLSPDCTDVSHRWRVRMLLCNLIRDVAEFWGRVAALINRPLTCRAPWGRGGTSLICHIWAQSLIIDQKRIKDRKFPSINVPSVSCCQKYTSRTPIQPEGNLYSDVGCAGRTLISGCALLLVSWTTGHGRYHRCLQLMMLALIDGTALFTLVVRLFCIGFFLPCWSLRLRNLYKNIHPLLCPLTSLCSTAAICQGGGCASVHPDLPGSWL